MSALVRTRQSWHRVAEHLLAATCKRATGAITLLPDDGGFRTPALPDGTVLAVAVDELCVRRDGSERRKRLSTLREAATFAGVEVGFPWRTSPPATDLEPDMALFIDEAAARSLGEWFDLGRRALDRLGGELAPGEPIRAHIFPEHFDLGMTVGTVNYGFSPGDEQIPVPYVYVGPHRPPPKDAFWNADFGAYRTWTEITTLDGAHEFLLAGHAAILSVRRRWVRSGGA